MKTHSLLIAFVCAGIGCATTAPTELVDAREAYRRASTGRAAQAAPAELHVANQALAEAEQSFRDNPDSYQTRDLAYVAQRKAQLAEATASISIEQKSQAQSKEDLQTAQGKAVAKTKQDLSKTRTALAASERSGEATAEKLSAEQEARAAAEKLAADAQAALAKLAAVKEEPAEWSLHSPGACSSHPTGRSCCPRRERDSTRWPRSCSPPASDTSRSRGTRTPRVRSTSTWTCHSVVRTRFVAT